LTDLFPIRFFAPTLAEQFKDAETSGIDNAMFRAKILQEKATCYCCRLTLSCFCYNKIGIGAYVQQLIVKFFLIFL
jgi:hypothetical protein